MTRRREFTKAQKAAMIKRATISNEVWCEGCGLNLTGKAIDFDHIIPEGLRPDEDKDRKLTIEDGQLLGRDCCHRGVDSKTSNDQSKIAKAKRIEIKHAGAKPEPKQKIKSHGFAKKQRLPKPSLPPRPMFKETSL